MSNENSSKGGTDEKIKSYGEMHSVRELFDPTTYSISYSVELVDNYERRFGIIREAAIMAYL